MSVSVSKFAVLPDDVPDKKSKKRTRKISTTIELDANTKKSLSSKQQLNGKCDTKSNSQSNSKNSASTSSSAKPKNDTKKKQKANAGQWKEWKEKDDVFVLDAFQKDLQNALLLSKIDFESNAVKTTDGVQKSSADKKKDSVILTTAKPEVKHSPSKANNNSTNKVQKKKNVAVLEEDFANDAKNIIKKEKQKEIVSKRNPPVPESVRILQLSNELEVKTKEIEEGLNREQLLQEELQKFQSMNKKLCEILAKSSNKEKSQLLLEIGDLKKVNDELKEQISELLTSTEQDRTKIKGLQEELRKYQKK